MTEQRRPTTYWDYIKVEELLKLQGGLEATDEHLVDDEVLFITVHQIDELWFKLLIRELVSTRNLFKLARVPETELGKAVRGLRRMSILLKQVAAHFELMETMTTRDYLSFRDKLSPASGFQSGQLREIEILVGLQDQVRIPYGTEKDYTKALRNEDGSESPAYKRVHHRLHDLPSLRDGIEAWLYRTPIFGSIPDGEGSNQSDAAAVMRFIERYLVAHERETKQAEFFAIHDSMSAAEKERVRQRFVREREQTRAFLLAEDTAEEERARRSRIRAALVFIESYRELPLLSWPREILDGLVEFEQSFVVFRQRHARMVERVIGRRTGTGGSAGVDYLDKTALAYRIFSDLWAVRTILVRKDFLPVLEQSGAYSLPVED